MKRFERLCVEQAELCVLEESWRALHTLAGNYVKYPNDRTAQEQQFANQHPNVANRLRSCRG